ncbi:FxSxx-COOH cyclophane-containing RiPP peptide [Saccharopolyspora gloriosae]|uniref:FxSxx-COOH cyclophane-containing RiPP peptide n=1 Tax=Saccharopolyspora gloriosae TaxID=455344 RepID=UPI001FB856E8|nr:FxSxx-COOH cyclophane-containing RiPP peptide [Saccharopolyspora gloriosae]
MDGDVPEPESGLIDLTEVPLDRLRSLDDSVLSYAIRRKLRELDDAPEVLAAFDNSISSSFFPGTN